MKILSVNTARAAKRLIQGRSVVTATGCLPMGVFALGLEGDEQADQSVHGGRSKAVYLYPVQHHAFWQTVRAQAGVAAADAPIEPGLFGENLTVDGIDESQLWIGDVLRGPGCTLVVSEPRNPCYKFNAVMGFPQASSLMNQSGYCGAYLAVLHPGLVQAGEEFVLEPGPREVNLRELFLAKHQRGRATWR